MSDLQTQMIVNEIAKGFLLLAKVYFVLWFLTQAFTFLDSYIYHSESLDKLLKNKGVKKEDILKSLFFLFLFISAFVFYLFFIIQTLVNI